MRQRKWTFYKVILYLGLISAVGLFAGLFYTTFFQYTSEWKELRSQLILLTALLQITFYLLCFRLVHYYIPNRHQPGTSFKIIHTLLLILNSCIAVWSLYVLAVYFSKGILNATGAPDLMNYKILFTIGSYTFITLYLSAASVVLRRYNRYQVTIDEEEWLSQLGNSSLNA